MESKYYSAKDICQLTGYKEKKAYDIIKQLNVELKNLYKDKPEEEKPLILNGRVLKSYFDRKVELNENTKKDLLCNQQIR